MRKAKYRAINALSSKYGIMPICRILNIKRCSYYKWLKNNKGAEKEIELCKAIAKIQETTKQTYGYRRMKIALEKSLKIRINHKRVLRIMNKYNLLSVIRRKYLYKGSYALNRYENLFNRDFDAQAINQKWTTDISYIITPEGRLYLSVIKDCFDASIVAYKYSTNMTLGLVTNTIKAAAQKENIAGIRIHSDQGFQYTSNEYNSLTKEYGIIPSMSRAGTPIDNAPIESFFSILKSECIYLQKIKTIQEAKDLIDEFIDYYNNDRIQLKSKLAPLEIRKNYLLQASL